MSSHLHSLAYFTRLPWNIQWRTALVQLPRYVPLSILHLTSPKGPQPFVLALPNRKCATVPIYVFVPPEPVDIGDGEGIRVRESDGEWKVPVVLDFHGGGFIMGSPLEQAPYASMMARELGAVVISVSYRIGPFHQFPAAIHDAEDVLSAILDTDGTSEAGRALRTEVNRYHAMVQEESEKKQEEKSKKQSVDGHNSPSPRKTSIVLDPSRLCISGFSAGGNIALNMAVNAPPCDQMLPTSPRSASDSHPNGQPQSPVLPPKRAATILDDPAQPWPSLLPPPIAQPRLIPLLLFYPSLDARLLPHERPRREMPSALKADDKSTQQPNRPGLFSIMGPTYLPKKLRAHPRASPGLVDPSNIQQNAAIFLVLPENDSLAVQSDMWVEKIKTGGWTGPVRFGDGREGDWSGTGHGTAAQAQTSRPSRNGGLEVWHAPKCRHGWTQFPTPALGHHEKSERDLAFARMLDFVKESWRRELPVPKLENIAPEMQPQRISGDFRGLC